MKLCYKAVMIVYTDFKALYMDKAWSTEYRHIDEDALNALRAERKSRYQSLFQNVEVCNTVTCLDQDVLSVDGIVMSGNDCLGNERSIHLGNIFIQVLKITGGVGMTPHQNAEMNRKNILRVKEALEEELLTVYGVDPEELDEIADPYWQNVHTRYGVVIPEGKLK